MHDFIVNFMPWFWLAILIVSIIIEACTFGLITIWAGIASIPMIFIARTGMPVKWQLLIFVLLTTVLTVITRPLAVRYFKSGKQSDKNINALDGQEVLCLTEISEFKFGEVKTKNGVVWTAKSLDGSVIQPDSICIVAGVEGNTLAVKIK